MSENPTLAPIVLFAFDRPEHLSLVLTALKNNDGAASTKLIVYHDGIPQNADNQLVERHALVSTALKNCQWPGAFELHERPTNLGLVTNITQALDEVFNRFPAAIILEDDILPARGFISFMNAALRAYADDEQVAGISGFAFRDLDIGSSHYFLRNGSCWGWATWSRVWLRYENNPQMYADQILKMGAVEAFDAGGVYPYYQLLQKQIAGKVKSWAISFYASYFIRNQYFVYPRLRLVQNIGISGGANTRGKGGLEWDKDQLNRTLEFKVEKPRLSPEIERDIRVVMQPRKSVVQTLKNWWVGS